MFGLQRRPRPISMSDLRNHLLFALSVPFVLLSGCGKNDPIYKVEPYIEFRAIKPQTINEFDPFTIEISFQDGDGDLGGTLEGGDSSAFNLYVQDLRSGYPLPDGGFDGVFRYTLPNLTPESRNPSIQGEILIDMSDIGVINSDSLEEHAIFRIWVFDRAGNRSNDVITDPILITRQ